LYITREALEGMACRQAAENMTAQEIDHMQVILASHATEKALHRVSLITKMKEMMISTIR
jgi:DNA-binding GntR family transcriptional regulator